MTISGINGLIKFAIFTGLSSCVFKTFVYIRSWFKKANNVNKNKTEYTSYVDLNPPNWNNVAIKTNVTANIENPNPLPIKLASTDSKPIDLTKLGLKIIDNDIKPPKNIKNI